MRRARPDCAFERERNVDDRANHNHYGRQTKGKIFARRHRRVQQAPVCLLQAASNRSQRRKGPGRNERRRDGAGEAQRRRAHPGADQAGSVCNRAGNRGTDVVIGKAVGGAGQAGPARAQPGGLCDRRIAGTGRHGAEACGCAVVVFEDDVSASISAVGTVGAGLSGVSD